MSGHARRRDRGWRALRDGPVRLLVADEIAGLVDRLGLDRPWDVVAPRPEGPGTGRGPRGVVRADQGPPLLVKRCLRGGLPARLNAERYFFAGRFVRELDVSVRASRAGLPVGDTLAAVLRPARPGWHAWTASRFIEDAVDLARALPGPMTEDARRACLRAAARAIVTIHRGGLQHRDLNLGNVVVRPCGPGAWEAFVVDLDRARWVGRPLGASARRAARDRLGRSWRKIFGTEAPLPVADLSALLLEPVARGTV